MTSWSPERIASVVYLVIGAAFGIVTLVRLRHRGHTAPDGWELVLAAVSLWPAVLVFLWIDWVYLRQRRRRLRRRPTESEATRR